MGQEESVPLDGSVPPQTLSARNLSAVAEHVKNVKPGRIVVLTGAGISTAAGIPDFRSPETGLYANLARLDLPYAEAVFDISYFRNNPEPFYVLARELYPGKFHPTISHAFISLLARKGLLHLLFTQNIDCLERRAGVPADKIVEAHGSFATQRCIDCKKEFADDKMTGHVERGEVPRCEDKTCIGLVKPDIVFFGEMLPKEFDRRSSEVGLADLVLVIGTSLTVYPFAALPKMTSEGTPRVLFNLEQVGSMGTKPDDVLVLGECDKGIRKLADELGWRDELEELWKSIVGEKEAQRQTGSQRAHEDELEEEVDKLAGDVESALNFEEAAEEGRKDQDAESKSEDAKVIDSKEVRPSTVEDNASRTEAEESAGEPQGPKEKPDRSEPESKPAEDKPEEKSTAEPRDVEKSVL